MADKKAEPVSLSDLNASIEKLQNVVSDMTKALSNEAADKSVADKSVAETLLIEWEKDIKGLEEKEKKLIKDLNQVMSNLYLLPAYVLAVSTSVSGLLGSDPHFCWIFSHVILVVIIFLMSMRLALRFAYRQLEVLEAKKGDLVKERVRLHRSFLDNEESFDAPTCSTNMVLKTLKSYETENFELDFQARNYDKYLFLITISGLVYAAMLLVAGYFVLCGSKAIPVEHVPAHLPFCQCSSSALRLHQDM